MNVRCPHCHNPIELIDDATLADIECPSCGSSFDLLRDSSTVSYKPGKHEQIAHFELIERLGVGAFGTVWKARDTHLDRIVALKVPRKSQLDDAETEQFIREARAAAQLHHPNIVSVHEVGRDGTTVFIVADLVDGLTLSDWITGQTSTQQEAAQLCATVARAVHHAHECGVIHRDLKPSNVMIDKEGTPHVMDFGLAKREAGEITVTVQGQVLGTPAYMSPEQARGDSHHVDRRSDVYSIGVILFELLTNEKPFRGNARMLLHQVVHDDAPSPRKLNSNIQRDLETICLRCLEKDPDKRFQSAEYLASELQRFLDGQPIHSRPISQIERGWRWCKRNPILASLSTGLAVALLVLAIAGPIVSYREKSLRGKAEESATDALTAKANAERSEEQAKIDREKAITAAEEATLARAKAIESQSAAQLEADRAIFFASEVNRSQLESTENLYLAHMMLAQRAVKEGAKDRALELLRRYQPKSGGPDLRGFEWGYLWQQCHVPALTFWQAAGPGRQHTNHARGAYFTPDGAELSFVYGRGEHNAPYVFVVNFVTGEINRDAVSPPFSNYRYGERSPDGKLILVYDDKNQAHVLEFAKSRVVSTLTGHTGPVYGGRFSPDSTTVVTFASSTQNECFGWNVSDGTKLFSYIPSPGNVKACAFSHDGATLMLGMQHGTFAFLDSSDGLEKRTFGNEETHDYLNCVELHPDGQSLVAGFGDGTVQLWNVEEGVLTHSFHDHLHYINSLSFSADGRYLATGASDSRVLIRDLAEKAIVRSLLVNNPANSLRFSPDGKLLVAAQHGSTTIWELHELPATVSRGSADTRQGQLKYAPDGDRVACAGINQVGLWDPRTGKPVRTLEGSADACEFSPDGRLIAVGSRPAGAIRFFNPKTGEEVEKPLELPDATQLHSISFSKDGSRLAACTQAGSVVAWELTTRQRLLKATAPVSETAYNKPTDVIWSPDGKELYCHIAGPMCVVYRIDTGRIHRTLVYHSRGFYSSAALSPDGELFAHEDSKRLIIRNSRSGDILHDLRQHSQDIYCVAFSNDGKTVASGSGDKTIKLWDIDTGKLRFSLEGHEHNVVGIAFSPDGQTVVSAGADQVLRFWRSDPNAGSSLEVRSLAFSPVDPSKLCIGRINGTIDFWNIATRQVELTIKAHDQPVQSIAFSPDGAKLVTTGLNESAHIWNSLNGDFVSQLPIRESRIERALFSPDGKLLVVTSWDQSTIWDVQSGEMLSTMSSIVPVAIDFTPDSKLIITSDHQSNDILVISVPTGLTTQRFPGHEQLVAHLDCSPDGTMVASTSFDGTMRLWNLKTGKNITTHKSFDQFGTECKFTNDSRSVFWKGIDGQLWTWKLASEEPPQPLNTKINHLGRHASALAVSLDGRFLAEGALNGSTLVRNLPELSVDHLVRRDSIAEAYTKRNYTFKESNDPASLDVRTQQAQDLERSNAIWSLQFSSDGSKLLTADRQGVLQIWDSVSQQLERELISFRSPIKAIFSDDGNRVISASNSSRIQMWDWRTGRDLKQIQHSDRPVSWISASHNKHYFGTTGADGKARVYDSRTGELLATLELERGHGSGVSFSPDDELLAVTYGQNRCVALWEWKTQRLVSEFEEVQDKITVFTPDGKELISVGEKGGAPIRINLSTSKLMPVPETMNGVRFISFSQSGNLCATGHVSGQVQIWNAKNFSLLNTIPMMHRNGINWLDFSSDETKLASVGADGLVKLWEVPTGELLGRLGSNSQVRATMSAERPVLQPVSDSQKLLSSSFQGFWIDVLPNQPMFCVGCDDGLVRLCDIRTGHVLQELGENHPAVQCVAVSHSGEFVAAGHREGVMRIWDVKKQSPIYESKSFGPQIRGCVWSADDKHVCFSSGGNLVSLDISTGKTKQVPQSFPVIVNQIMISPDAATFVVADHRGNVTLHDTATLKQRRVLPTHQSVCWACYSPSGEHVASTALDGVVRLWDLREQKLIAETKVPFRASRVCFLSEKEVLVCGERGETSLWDVENNLASPAPFAHVGGIYGARISKDAEGDKLILAGGTDGAISIWDVNQKTLVRQADLRRRSSSQPLKVQGLSP